MLLWWPDNFILWETRYIPCLLANGVFLSLFLFYERTWHAVNSLDQKQMAVLKRPTVVSRCKFSNEVALCYKIFTLFKGANEQLKWLSMWKFENHQVEASRNKIRFELFSLLFNFFFKLEKPTDIRHLTLKYQSAEEWMNLW